MFAIVTGFMVLVLLGSIFLAGGQENIARKATPLFIGAALSMCLYTGGTMLLLILSKI